MVREYGLLGEGEVKLHTQIELSTLFYEHCARVYRKPGGTVAFVMPRSVLTGAKQHRAFQQFGFSKVLDLEDVAPLFKVPTCVLVRGGGGVATENIPAVMYAGRLPAQECGWERAEGALSARGGTISFAERGEVASPYYHPRVINGANLYLRNLVFVASAQPDLAEGQMAHSSIMRSDSDVDAEAKAPWKGLALQGHIDDEFLYATLLSKNLVPFGVRRLHLVALPVRVGYPGQTAEVPGQERERRFLAMSPGEMRDTINYAKSAEEWFERAEKLWSEHKKATTKESLAGWLNYQNKIGQQSAEPGYLVLYNATGSNLSSAVIQTETLPVINGVAPHVFVVDHKTYWCHAAGFAESHYLAALLNAPSVDYAIKPHQTRGTFGARDIHRRPFEVCAIPEFDAANADHQALAALSREAHAAVARLDLRAGGVVAARKRARAAAREHLQRIDALAQRLLGLAPAPGGMPVEDEVEEGEIEAEGEG